MHDRAAVAAVAVAPGSPVAVGVVLVNVAYSLLLKNIVILDAMTLALSFVVRAYAGAAAIDVPASKWMLTNTLLLALFLGFGKRRHELVLLENDAHTHRKSLSNYSPYLLDQLIGVTETRMGKGKGAPEEWVAVIKPGRVMYEIDGVTESMAREALRLAAHKLPIRTRTTVRNEVVQ